MAVIFYGVAGEGNGHAIRTEIISQELQKQHHVHIFSHGRGYYYLKNHFPVRKILGFHMYYLNNTVSSLLTGILNAIKFPLMALISLRYIPAFCKEKPDVVITDFEPFLCYWAKLFHVPVVSIDNQHSITHTEIDSIPGQRIPELYSRAVIYAFLPAPEIIFITSFFRTKPKPNLKNVSIFPPLVREKILAATPENKGHILVYQTSQSYKKLFPILRNIKKEFIIYGFDREKKEGNLLFKRWNTQQYIDDLRTADAVIINGGFTVLSEALYLQKPLFSIPIKRQFEQIVNGYYLNKLGYGNVVEEITEKNFHAFLEKKEEYRKNIRRIKWDKNKKFFVALEAAVHKIIAQTSSRTETIL